MCVCVRVLKRESITRFTLFTHALSLSPLPHTHSSASFSFSHTHSLIPQTHTLIRLLQLSLIFAHTHFHLSLPHSPLPSVSYSTASHIERHVIAYTCTRKITHVAYICNVGTAKQRIFCNRNSKSLYPRDRSLQCRPSWQGLPPFFLDCIVLKHERILSISTEQD